MKELKLHTLRMYEASHDFWTESIKELNPLLQFDPEPNKELKEAKVELYKISVSFNRIFEGTPAQIQAMKGSKHQVLFRNADVNINMGVIFNDPDLGLSDFYWYLTLAEMMEKSLQENEGLITVDRKQKQDHVTLNFTGMEEIIAL